MSGADVSMKLWTDLTLMHLDDDDDDDNDDDDDDDDVDSVCDMIVSL